MLGLRETATGVADEAMVDGPAPLTFAIREGWKAVTLDVGGALPEVLRLRKKTGGFFDSQFVHYVRSLATGDFGVSTEHSLPRRLRAAAKATRRMRRISLSL